MRWQGLVVAVALAVGGAVGAQELDMPTPSTNPALRVVGDRLIQGINQMTQDARDEEQFWKNHIKWIDALGQRRKEAEAYRKGLDAVNRELEEKKARLEDVKFKDEAEYNRRKKEYDDAKAKLTQSGQDLKVVEGSLKVVHDFLMQANADPQRWNDKTHPLKNQTFKALEILGSHSKKFEGNFKQAQAIIDRRSPLETNVDKHAAFSARVVSIKAKDMEFWVGTTKLAPEMTFPLDKDTFELRAQVAGPRRKQARDLVDKKKATGDDWQFSYSVANHSSTWTVTGETYDWSVSKRTNKPLIEKKRPSHTGVKDDINAMTIASDTGSETLFITVSGNVTWELKALRQGKFDRSDKNDENDTASIELAIAPPK
jgi:hypothetical protein